MLTRCSPSKTGGLEHKSCLQTFYAQVTLVAWYQLRQEHLLAKADIPENQGVVMRVTLL